MGGALSHSQLLEVILVTLIVGLRALILGERVLNSSIV